MSTVRKYFRPLYKKAQVWDSEVIARRAGKPLVAIPYSDAMYEWETPTFGEIKYRFHGGNLYVVSDKIEGFGKETWVEYSSYESENLLKAALRPLEHPILVPMGWVTRYEAKDDIEFPDDARINQLEACSGFLPVPYGPDRMFVGDIVRHQHRPLLVTREPEWSPFDGWVIGVRNLVPDLHTRYFDDPSIELILGAPILTTEPAYTLPLYTESYRIEWLASTAELHAVLPFTTIPDNKEVANEDYAVISEGTKRRLSEQDI